MHSFWQSIAVNLKDPKGTKLITEVKVPHSVFLFSDALRNICCLVYFGVNTLSVALHCVFCQLAKVCDVLVENYLPGKLNEMGLGYEELSKVAPQLIYCSITGEHNIHDMQIQIHKPFP